MKNLLKYKADSKSKDFFIFIRKDKSKIDKILFCSQQREKLNYPF